VTTEAQTVARPSEQSDPLAERQAHSNGHAPLLTGDESIIATIQVQVDQLEARRAELQAQLDEITPQLRRYEKAVTALRGEPLTKARPRVDPETGEVLRQKPGPKPKGRTTKGISDEIVAQVEQVFRELAIERDDVAQVDVRAKLGIGSGAAALAFAELRNRGVIRLAGQTGLRKNFRLTRAALNGDAPTPPDEPLTLDELQNAHVEAVSPVTRMGTKAPQVSENRLEQILDAIRGLTKDGEPTSQTDVANRTTVSSGTVTNAFFELQERGMIEFVRKDGNRKMYRLTDKGEA
jgi:ribosomal protein S25